MIIHISALRCFSFMLPLLFFLSSGNCLPRILFSEFKNNEQYGQLVINTFRSSEFDFELITNLEYIADDPKDYVSLGDFVIDPEFSILPDGKMTQIFSLKLYKGCDVISGDYRSKNMLPEYFTINVDASINFSQWLACVSREIKAFQYGIIKSFRKKVMHLDLITEEPKLILRIGYRNNEMLKLELVDKLRGYSLMSETYVTFLEAVDAQSRNYMSHNLYLRTDNKDNISIRLNARLKVPGKTSINLGELNCGRTDFDDVLTKYIDGIINKLENLKIIP